MNMTLLEILLHENIIIPHDLLHLHVQPIKQSSTHLRMHWVQWVHYTTLADKCVYYSNDDDKIWVFCAVLARGSQNYSKLRN